MKKFKIFYVLFAAALLMTGCKGEPEPNPDNGDTPVVDTTPSIKMEKEAIVLDNGIPGISAGQIHAIAANNGESPVQWKVTGNCFSLEDNGNGYASVIPVLGGKSTVTASFTLNGTEYKAKTSVTVNLAQAEDSNLTITAEDITSSGFNVLLTKPEELSVIHYVFVLYKGDVIELSGTLDKEVAEIDFSQKKLTAETEYKIVVYCVYEKEGNTVYSKNTFETSTISDDKNPDPVVLNEEKTGADQNTIKLVWTNPADEDLGSVNIKVTKDGETEAAKNVTVSEGVNLNALAESGYTVEGLEYSTKYSVEITIYDVNNHASTVVLTELTTGADTTPAGKVSAVKASLSDYADGNVKAKLSWTNPSDEDFDKVEIYKGTELLATVSENGQTAELSNIALGTEYTIRTLDAVGNENDFALSIPAAASFVTDAASLTLTQGYTGELLVSDFACAVENENYTTKYSFTASSSDADAVEVTTASYAAKDEKDNAVTVSIAGLTPYASYSVKEITTLSSENIELSMVSANSSAEKTVEKIVWEIHAVWAGYGFVAPYIFADESKDYRNVILAGDNDTQYTDVANLKYNGWIVYPAANGASGKFTLEATDVATGKESGLYAYAGGYTSESNVDWKCVGADWGFSSSLPWYLLVTDSFDAETADSSMKDKMSFDLWNIGREAALPEEYEILNNQWYGIGCRAYLNPNLWGSCANFASNSSWDTIKKSDFYDSSFFICQHVFDGTDKEPAEPVITPLSCDDHNASLKYTVSPSNLESVTVSIDGTDIFGNAISEVVFNSPRGTNGSKTVPVSNLRAGIYYTVTVTAKTVTGKTKSSEFHFFTYSDFTAPDTVSEVSGSSSRSSILLNWKNPSDADFKGVKIVPYKVEGENETAESEIILGNNVTSYLFNVTSGDSYKYEISTFDYDENYSEKVTTETYSTSNPVATNVTAEARWTSEILVKWTDTSAVEKDGEGNDVTYSYEVTCKDSEGNVVASKNVASGNGLAQFTGLTVGNEYTFTVATVASDAEETPFVSSTIPSATARRVTAVYSNNQSSTPYLVANSAKLPITNNGNSAGYSTSWVVHPALDGSITYTYTADNSNESAAVKKETGTVDTFSLEAITAGGADSGLYYNLVSIDSSKTSKTAVTDLIAAPESFVGKEAYATFMNATTKVSGYPYCLRPVAEGGQFQTGAESKVVYYRYSAGSPGVTMWTWKVAYTYSTSSN